jgi:glycosyltransferase involved in cell wall biosynthesis
MVNNKNEDSVKVTVIMSVYNGEGHVGEAVDSIIGQTFTGWEFLIVDDASTDGTAAILRDYASRDGRIKILTNAKNVGLTKSLNIAISNARAELLARQDADDISAPGRLEQQLNYMEQHTKVAVVGCLGELYSANGIVKRGSDRKFSRAGIKRYLANNNVFIHGSVMMRKSCLAKVGFYREFFRYSQDYDLWLRLSEHFDLAILPEHLYRRSMTAEAVSVSQRLTQKQYADIAKKLHVERLEKGKDSYETLILSHPDGLPIRKDTIDKYDYHLSLAKQLIIANKLKQARQELWKTWESGCRKKELFWLLFKSFLGAWLLDLYRGLRDFKFRS